MKKQVYAFIATEPAANDFKYCSQIRESARSGPANIAEGFGRFYSREFAQFLDYARASLIETQNHLTDGRDSHFLDDGAYQELHHLADRAIGATTNLAKYLRRKFGSSHEQRRTRK